MEERDLSPRLARIAKGAWLRIPPAVRNELLARGLKMVEADLPSDRLADAGADCVIRLDRRLPDGERGQYVVAHEVAHVYHGHPGPALRDEIKRAQFEDEANRQAQAWGFRWDAPRQVWAPAGSSGSFRLVTV